MGIEAKGHNSTISDIDVKAIKNMILHSRKKTAETKIVKASTTRTKRQALRKEEVKISVKPAAVATVKTKEKVDLKGRKEPRPMQSRMATPSQGVAQPKTNIAQPPVGVPLPKSASKQPIKEKQETLKQEEIKDKISKAKEPAKKESKKETVKLETPKAPKTREPVQAETPQTKKPVKTEVHKVEKSIKEEAPKAKELIKTEGKKEPEQKVRESTDREPKAKAPKTKAPKNNTPKTKVAKVAGTKEESDEGIRLTSKASKTTVKKDRNEKKQDQKKAVHKKSLEKPAPKKTRKHKGQKVEEPESKINLEELAPGTKVINVPITVKGLSEQIEKTTSDVIMALMKLGVMANINQNLDEDTVVLLGEELGITIVVDKIEKEVVEEGLETFEDETEDLIARPPVITVMGHVDHGKTSLLDAIRKTNVTSTESGGITQHIGASEAIINGQRIVFLDTPGHEAFTTMRARGAHVTDIAVLVVAADDSVKPQTVESISHAKAAGVPIIVAINKMDKPEANLERVKQDLTEYGILVEEWGGDVICVPVSAKTGEGIVNLLEMILLQSEVLELKANPNRLAMGTVIEARLDKAKGPVSTLLVLNGTLEVGMSIVAGICSGRIRAMTNYKGDSIEKAGPATAVEIIGLTEVPEAGDEFNAVKEDRIARDIAEQRRLKLREEVMARNSSTTLEQLFSQIQEGVVKELNLVIKADVQGSVGALTQSLEKLQTENVKVKIIHTGVGTITESDIMLASTSDAIIIGFNVRPGSNITAMAELENVEIRSYRIIYEIIDDIEAAIKGMLDPIYKEVIIGKVEIRNTFKVPGVGIIGGSYVLEGKVQRNAGIRLVRDSIVIHEGKISSLKRFKDDAKEVAQGYECGIGIENFNDIKEGDIIEVFKMEEIERK
ncbi:MAG: translation initiation factor IF-2 [Eubacteriales bacterium]|nr:translation initiation factor IF-2 [Eubacteriales bacterium]